MTDREWDEAEASMDDPPRGQSLNHGIPFVRPLGRGEVQLSASPRESTSAFEPLVTLCLSGFIFQRKGTSSNRDRHLQGLDRNLANC